MSSYTRSGFTIVELLIVVVVIAILAAITIVAYNGIQERARGSSSLAAAKQVATKISLYSIDNGSFPPALTDIGITNNGGTTYQYSVNNSASPKTWCVTATSGNRSAYASSTQESPLSGACVGHNANGVITITNIALGARAQNTWAFYNDNSSYWVVTRQVAMSAPDGIATVAESRIVSGASTGILLSMYNIDGQSNTYPTARSLSAWVRVNAEGYRVHDSTGIWPTTVLPADTWVRVGTAIPEPANSWSGIRISKISGSAAESDRAWITGIMAVDGTQNYAFRDGASPGWTWSGAANTSTSTGPAP